MTHTRRPWVVVVSVIGALLAMVVATAVSARLHLDLPVGRRALGDAIEHLAGSEINGTLTIGRVEEAGFDRIVAHDIEIRDREEGQVLLGVEHAVIEPDLGRLIGERHIATRSIRVDGAVLRMVQGPDGLTVERALEPPNPTPGGGPPTFFLDFAGLHFERLQTFWRLAGAPSFRIDDVSGFGRIGTDERGNVVMRFDRLAGELRTTSLPIEVSAGVRRANGRIHAGWDRMGRFDIELDLAGSRMELELDLYDRPGGLQAQMNAESDGALAWLAALGVEIGNDVGGTRGTSDEAEAEDEDEPEESK